MTLEQKNEYLYSIANYKYLENKDLLFLREMSNDTDSFVRCLVAETLVNFVGEDTKRILFKLAKDNVDMVRTEAYDSLSSFFFIDVLQFLHAAILNEKDPLARSFAILSFADVSIEVCSITQETICEIKTLLNDEKSMMCVASYYYALYLFGETEYLHKLLLLLFDEDYHIRCSTISLLTSIVNISNQDIINNAISQALLIEKNDIVVKRLESFLRQSKRQGTVPCLDKDQNSQG